MQSRVTRIPLTGRQAPWGCEMLNIPQCLDNRLTDGGEVLSLRRPPRSTCQEHFLVLISLRGPVNPRALMRLEG
jgi:hypothetical protein